MSKDIDKLLKSLSKPTNLLAAIFGLGLLVIIIIAVSSGGGQSEVAKKPELSDGQIVQVKRGDRIFTLDKRKGVAEYRTSEYVFYENWEEDKVDAFIKYIELNAQSSVDFGTGDGFYGVTYTSGSGDQGAGIGGDDELLDIVFDQFDEEEEEGDEGSVSEYFDDDPVTPTPTPDTSGPGGNGDGDGDEDEFCPFWRLSYCMYPPDPTATPEPTPTGGADIPYVFDCSLGEDLVSDRTIISNILCIKDSQGQ